MPDLVCVLILAAIASAAALVAWDFFLRWRADVKRNRLKPRRD